MPRTLLVYNHPEQTLKRDAPLEAIDQLCAQPDNVLWLDIVAPQPDDIRLLQEEFAFHPLALEDVQKAHQRPKMEHYEGYVFMVAYSTVFDSQAHTFRSEEINLFIGKNYLVSVHEKPVPSLELAERRWLEHQEMMAEGAGFLTYLIVDGIVDEYFPALEIISDELEDLEDRIFAGDGQPILQSIFSLKKELLQFRRMVAPLRDVFSTLVKRESPLFGPHTVTYFQDIYDHLLRVSDSIDTFRDLLTSSVDLYMSSVSNRMNAVMKILTVIATVLMTAALIAGIYGMNFERMPELKWPNGYYYALSLMVTAGLLVAGLFRWRRYI